MKGLVNAESHTEGRYKRDWDGRLSEKAELLLSNHSFLVEMTEVHRIAMYVVFKCVCVCVCVLASGMENYTDFYIDDDNEAL